MVDYESFRTELAKYSTHFQDGGPMLSLEQWHLHRKTHERPLDKSDMIRVVDAALVTLRGLYVHIDLKRARRGIDPLNQLRVLKDRLNAQPQPDLRTFHNTMLGIFKSLGDVHTAYRLPRPYLNAIAFLPFLMNVYFDRDQRRRYVATRVLWPPESGAWKPFGPGVEIVSWNGTPIDEAVRFNTEFEEGSNEPHDLALALQFMNVRWLGASYEPDSPWVDVEYKTAPQQPTLSFRFFWTVLVLKRGLRLLVADQAESIIFGVRRPSQQRERAVHVASQVVHTWRKKVFVSTKTNEDAERMSQRITAAGAELVRLFTGYVGRTELRDFTEKHGVLLQPQSPDEVPTLLPLFFEARVHDGTNLVDRGVKGNYRLDVEPDEIAAIKEKKFGYIGIRAFAIQEPERGVFKYEFARLLSLMPRDALILDLRDNPGGSTRNAEESLQFLTPHRITPLSFRFIASEMTRDLAKEKSVFEEYSQSIRTALTTGGAFSAGRPITDPIRANSAGQFYLGPVVLVTSATTYSAGDMFAAGFEDNKIGPIICVDETTGAGGANSWFYREEIRPNIPVPPLPAGINMQVAVRQCTRQGDVTSGLPIEETGIQVVDKNLYRLQEIDVVNADQRPWGLLLRAAREVAKQNSVNLDPQLSVKDGQLVVVVESQGIDRLDFYVNGRPTSHKVGAVINAHADRPQHRTKFRLNVNGRLTLEIRGFANQDGDETLVARRVQFFNADIELGNRT